MIVCQVLDKKFGLVGHLSFEQLPQLVRDESAEGSVSSFLTKAGAGLRWPVGYFCCVTIRKRDDHHSYSKESLQLLRLK